MTEQESRDAVVAEARSWLGTPYHHYARIKGEGVDCAQLLIAVFSTVGIVDAFDPGQYPRDWHMHRSEERYLSHLAKHAHRVDFPRPADVVVYKFGRCFSHGTIAVSHNEVVHAYVGRGVILSRMNDEPLGHRRERQYWSVFT